MVSLKKQVLTVVRDLFEVRVRRDTEQATPPEAASAEVHPSSSAMHNPSSSAM
jgi:hypothetical protein